MRAIAVGQILPTLVAAVTITACACCCCAKAQLPSDVRSNHWAATAVQQTVKLGIIPLQSDHQFHGEAHVTRTEAVNALAALARQLLAGSWQVQKSEPVPEKVAATMQQDAWKNKQVTRYELSSVLSRFGNYFAHAVTRPKPGSTDVGRSAIPPKGVSPGVPTTHPAYTALKFLTDNRMIHADSPLLHADTTFVKASELSLALAEMASGLTDKLTELGLDADGNTPDNSFHSKKPGSAGGKQ